jgi:hypothetical protein
MKMRPTDWLAWSLSFVVLAAFFIPWFKYAPSRQAHTARRDVVAQLKASSERSFGATYLTISPREQARALHEPMRGTGGYELPLLTQEPNQTRLLSALAGSRLFGEERLHDRLMMVYALPALAFFSAAFMSGCQKRWPLLLPLLSVGIVYGAARHQLNETYFERMAAGIDPGIGLWISLYGLLALCVLLVLRFILPPQWRI